MHAIFNLMLRMNPFGTKKNGHRYARRFYILRTLFPIFFRKEHDNSTVHMRKATIHPPTILIYYALPLTLPAFSYEIVIPKYRILFKEIIETE